MNQCSNTIHFAPAFITKSVVLGKLRRLASNGFYIILNFSNWLNVEFPINNINDYI